MSSSASQLSASMVMPEIQVGDLTNYDPFFINHSLVSKFVGSAVLIIRNSLGDDEIKALETEAGNHDIKFSAEVSAQKVEELAPSLVKIGAIISAGFSPHEVQTRYQLRTRSPGHHIDSAIHADNAGSSLTDLAELRIRPGIRIIHQLSGGRAPIGTIRSGVDNTHYHGTIDDGDAWMIPKDRMLGLPIRTRDGMANLRHPRHFGINITRDRLILVQDITVPLGAFLTANTISRSSVLPHEITDCLSPEELQQFQVSQAITEARQAICELYEQISSH